uniref:Sema domain-containing protein n=1 Tax=Tetranychus urticae TaxID=32264 RepID=T1KXA5_TETUR
MLLFFIKDALIFYLTIKIACAFEAPKHYFNAFHKVHSNVYSIATQPNSYAVYVAGKIAYLTIATPNETDISKILNWRAINTDPTRLMFVSDNKPFILIDSTVIRPMSHQVALNGTIIELGNAEALHIPKIINPDGVDPKEVWNYFDLLLFDSKDEKVEKISSIDWIGAKDYEFILEYRVLDHIHFKNKLYLLMFRQVKSFPSPFNEISIIRLCLEKGSQFLSSAVEVAYKYDSKPISGVFYFDYTNPEEWKRYSIALINNQDSSTVTFHYIENFEALFDDVAYNCSTGLPGLSNLFLHHLRNQTPNGCVEEEYKDCDNGVRNIFPSGQISDKITVRSFLGPQNDSIKLFTHHHPYPINYVSFGIGSEEAIYICDFFDSLLLCSQSFYGQLTDYYPQLHMDVIHGKILIVHRDNTVSYVLMPCDIFRNCLYCSVYANKYCEWTIKDEECQSPEPKSLSPKTYVNFCNRIEQVQPSNFVGESPIPLKIIFFSTLNFIDPNELIKISAGPGSYCTSIEINDTIINCDLYFQQYGDFFVTVTFEDAFYADATPVSVVSLRQITINPKPKVYGNSIFVFIFFILIVIILLAIIYSLSSPINLDLSDKIFSRQNSHLEGSKLMSKPTSRSRSRFTRFSHF